jgi:hypothetical protein
MPRSVWQTFLATSRWASQFASPVLIALVVRPGGSKRTRRGRRAVITAMLVGFSLSEWATRRPKLDPVRFAMGVLADEAAYGAGVWRQCLRDKMWSPALPRFAAIHAPDLQAPDRTAPAVDGAY